MIWRSARPPAEPTIGELAQRAVADGKAALGAEVAVVKAIAAFRLSGLKLGVPLLVTALFLLQSVLTALVVGLILALAPAIGAGWATLLVIVLGLALVGLIAWIGVRKLSSLWAPLPPEEALP